MFKVVKDYNIDVDRNTAQKVENELRENLRFYPGKVELFGSINGNHSIVNYGSRDTVLVNWDGKIITDKKPLMNGKMNGANMVTIEELKAELDKVENENFYNRMIDRWSSENFDIENKTLSKIRQLERQLKALGCEIEEYH